MAGRKSNYPTDEVEDFGEEAYFDKGEKPRSFDTELLREPVATLRMRKPLVFAPGATVREAMRAMQAEHRGAILITEDGEFTTPLVGIFTERDVLYKIVDGGRDPAAISLADVMTKEPEALREEQTVAEALELMSVGGFRHVPVIDANHCPVFMVSVQGVTMFLVSAFSREILNQGGDRTQAREGA